MTKNMQMGEKLHKKLPTHKEFCGSGYLPNRLAAC